MANQVVVKAVFATVKNNVISHFFVVYAASREVAARQIAVKLKERFDGSLLDMALVDADSVAACYHEHEVVAQ